MEKNKDTRAKIYNGRRSETSPEIAAVCWAVLKPEQRVEALLLDTGLQREASQKNTP